MWHSHDGERCDFVPVKVVPIKGLLENVTSDEALDAFEIECDDPLMIGRPRREKFKAALERLFTPSHKEGNTHR
jgi:hypothetical protein